jgi:putative spermidine/putrescine transport system substrate-binding protein
MDRRSFLQLSLAASALGLAGCGNPGPSTTRILGLKDAVPPRLLKVFRDQMKDQPIAQLAYQQSNELQSLFSQLQTWQQQVQGKIPARSGLPNPIAKPVANPNDQLADLVSLGDFWLEVAIRQNLIEPLNPQQWSQWSKVDPMWQRWAQRDDQGRLSANGKVWAAPYRWGATIIAYRRDLLADRNLEPPKDWADLRRPEFKGRISLPDSAREVIGIGLKSLGKSYETGDGANRQPIDLTQVPELENQLRSLHQNIRFYSNTEYLQPFLLGHTWIAVGWSSDILPLFRTRSRELAVALPTSGTSLWADFWVRPKRSEGATIRPFDPWIDFFWNATVADKVALLGRSGSPLQTHAVNASSEEQQHNPLLNLPDQVWEKCEPLPPLDQARAEQYYSLFRKIRQ